MNANSKRILKFAIDYPGWNTMGKDRKDIACMVALEREGFLEVLRYGDGTKQFRIRQPKVTRQDA